MRDYLHISEALKYCRGDKKSNRDFGLINEGICANPLIALREWAYSRLSINNEHKEVVKNKLIFLRRILWISIILAIIFGVIASVSLLTYNGSKPVNIFYFLLFSVILPIFGLLFTILSIIEIKLSGESIAIDFMPPYWIMSFLKKDREDYKIPSTLIKAYIIYIAQIISMVFYISMLIGLVAVIVGKDVAFAWSSTLSLSPEELHNIFNILAFPWKEFLPSAVPSIELIKHSHYFRVGVWHPANISELGAWWRFLAMTIITYAILPRLILIPFTYRLYKRVKRDTIFGLDNASAVIDEICTPIIETKPNNKESHILTYDKNNSSHKIVKKDEKYNVVLGWSIFENDIKDYLKSKDIQIDRIIEVGGCNTLEEDIEAIDGISDKVLILVKSWEPPTMDFIDIIEYLSNQNAQIDIIPIGFIDDNYIADDSDFEIWKGKVNYLKIKNVKVIK